MTFFLTLLLLAASARAYESGTQLSIIHAERVAREGGRVLDVPLSYEFPEGPQTPLYYWFATPYDASKPTIVIFTGGPGQPSHIRAGAFYQEWHLRLVHHDVNVLLFDPRGVAFSRPAEERVQWGFYSSENVARDVERLRAHLGIAQLVVYGKSYGTVPATIYASKFASRTRALILEGTMTGVETRDENRAFVASTLQWFFDRLSCRAWILGLLDDDKKRVRLLSGVGMAFSFYGGRTGAEEMKAFLERANSWSQIEERFAQLEYGYRRSGELFEIDRNFSWALHRREFGGFDARGDLRLSREGRVEIAPPTEDELRKARELKATYGHPDYRASEYPTSVPTYYVQGSLDLATPLYGALAHWFGSGNPNAQFLVGEGEGHTVIGVVAGDVAQSEVLFEEWLPKMVRGERLTLDDVGAFNAAGPHRMSLYVDRAAGRARQVLSHVRSR